VREKKILARLASGLVFLLANREFYSHFGGLASGYPHSCNHALKGSALTLFGSVCLSGWLAGWLFIWLTVCLSVCLFVCLSVHLSVSNSVKHKKDTRVLKTYSSQIGA
jgi:hypothetical protein